MPRALDRDRERRFSGPSPGGRDRPHRRRGADERPGAGVSRAPHRRGRRARDGISADAGRLRAHPRRAEEGRLRQRAVRRVRPRVALDTRAGERAHRRADRTADSRWLVCLGAGPRARDDRAARRSRCAGVGRAAGPRRALPRRLRPRRSAEVGRGSVLRDALAAREDAGRGRSRRDADPVGQARAHGLHVGVRLLSARAAARRLRGEGRRRAAAAPSREGCGAPHPRREEHVRYVTVPRAQRHRRPSGARARRGRARRGALRLVGRGAGRRRRRLGCGRGARGGADPQVPRRHPAPHDPLRLLLRRRGGDARLAGLRRRAREGARFAARRARHGLRARARPWGSSSTAARICNRRRRRCSRRSRVSARPQRRSTRRSTAITARSWSSASRP